MKSILAIVLLVAMVQGSFWEQSNTGYSQVRVPPFQTNPGNGYGRQRNPFYNQWYQQQPHHHHHHQQQQQQHNEFVESSISNAEWICRNPKTGDMMIIASESGKPRPHNTGHHWQQPQYPQGQPNYPPGNYPGNNGSSQWNTNTQQKPTRPGEPNVHTDKVNSATTHSPEDSNNAKDKNTAADHSHGGVGLIDVRIGKH